ncbi:hypothetical protein TcasGA2_TC013375 [Tribolium castaneum]|uniref:Uncharacterized protein n=1 Tax=Tribolium castaneum TaxID=7070 RepID=D6WLX4_TRICA|nr:hypothetical protein TcasGA2_TC013375 [Tribolium castaneum]
MCCKCPPFTTLAVYLLLSILIGFYLHKAEGSVFRQFEHKLGIVHFRVHAVGRTSFGVAMADVGSEKDNADEFFMTIKRMHGRDIAIKSGVYALFTTTTFISGYGQ